MEKFSNLKKILTRESKIKPRYKYFTREGKRQDIYEFSRNLSDFLYKENIPNLVLIDRSPRPLWVGVDEYWKIHHQDKKRPNIYFVNPNGFDISKKIINSFASEEELDAFIRAGLEKVMALDEGVKDQFEQAYPKLKTQKDKPIAVFDNCIHTGETMMSVVTFFHRNGYKDIRIISGDNTRNFTDIRLAGDFTDTLNSPACKVFGRDSGVVKNDDFVFSQFDFGSDPEKVVQCREEIRRIVREKGA